MVFDEPGAAVTGRRLDDGRLIAPFLIDFEFANVSLLKLRRNQIQRGDLAIAYTLRLSFKIECLTVDFAKVLELAITTGLTAYDASYLWLARTHNAELVTLDKQLAAAFARVQAG